MSNPKVYRLAFDFKSEQKMKDFFVEFVRMTLSPEDDGTDYRHCTIVKEDDLHNKHRAIKKHLIRYDNSGNGVSIL